MSTRKLLIALTTVFALLAAGRRPEVDGANILALMGMTSPSHHIWNSVLIHELGRRGHNVTVLSVDLPHPHDKVPPTVHYIHLERAYDFNKAEALETKLDITQYIGVGPFESIPMFYDFGMKTAQLIYESQGVQQLLAYPRDFRFDLVINDFTLGPYMLGFAHHFGSPPIVGVSAFHNPPVTLDFMANHYFPAYTPFHATSYGPRMNFWERFHNTLVFAADTMYRRLYYNPRINALIRPHFDDDMPHVETLARRTAVALVNSNPAIDYLEPLPPNVIEVGGMQILEPEPLPQELDEFMRAAPRGAVLFSLGTNMNSRDMGSDKIRVVLQAFGNLSDYHFLWKFDREYLGDERVPANVLIRPFFPQRDVLAHPSIRAFATHCGGLSSQEATWRGVPMVGIPLFLDQHRNLRQSMLAGSALKVDYVTMTAETLAAAIRHVAEDREMAANVEARSRRFRDTPMKPLDRAVWWIEYLLREPNPVHLRSPATELNFFAAHSLDVLAVLALLVALFVVILRRLWSDLCSRPRGNRRSRHRKRE